MDFKTEWKKHPAAGPLRTFNAEAVGALQIPSEQKDFLAICVDESQDGAIFLLDHDFDMRETFVNSSVFHLAEALLAFRERPNGG